MLPDEEAPAAAEPGPIPSSRGPRRSRRGGRRRSRRRGGPGPSAPQSTDTSDLRETSAAATEESEFPAAREPESNLKGPAVSRAIEQVNQVIEELKRALDEMEVVLETLELAERQKIDDEREIESLERALRQLRRPGHGGQSQH